MQIATRPKNNQPSNQDDENANRQTSKLHAIKRLRYRSQSNLSGSSIPITEFHGPSFNGLKELKFDSVKATETITAAEMTLDLLRHSAWFFASSKGPRPN